MRLLLCLALLSCADRHPRVPKPRHAYCGTTCWNDGGCKGQGIACEHCVGGTCSSQPRLALEAER